MPDRPNVHNVVVIYNPLSGRGKSRHVAQQARARFKATGWHVSQVIPTEYAGDAESVLAAQWSNAVDLIVVSGGDGTQREVVSGIIRDGPRSGG